ncbi:MAG TPA: family 20 glycosylhydrolase [Opitutaceae bacterium]|nr:family 20 glycosylhydrolase [Opitutaceae bacterium]
MSLQSPQSQLPVRAFQWDLARQVERLDFLVRWLPRYADWGYQELYLHVEDAVEYPSLPGVARSDAYTYAQFTGLVEAATAAGIRVVPIVNLLGHTQYLVKVPGLRDLNELRDPSDHPLEHGQICPLHPRTLEIAERLLRDLAPFCTAGKVHVGLDESFHLGQCPRCRAEIARLGLAGHFAAHVRRLHGLTTALGLRLGLWADMLALLPAVIPRLPRDVIVYDWYYYPFARHPRVELHNFAEVDLATPLRARGIEYWGCPMNGAFRYEPLPVFGERLANIVSWWRRCCRAGAGGFLVTSWEANRLAIELPIAVDAAAACLWLDPDVADPREMLACGFERVFGKRGGRITAHAASVSDAHPFSGYYRWQINDRWDVCAGREPLAAYERQAHAFERLCRRLQAGSPTALTTSLAFRRYLAQRDVLVRRAAQVVFQLRRGCSVGLRSGPRGNSRRSQTGATLARLQREAADFALVLRIGRAAARAMWTRSRDPQERGPNELMLARDAERLRRWRRWLAQATRERDLIWQATPVCGAWQLQFTVHNFAPALQKVVVEQQRPNGSWKTLHALPLVEFRADAARPRTTIRREFSVPIAETNAQVGCLIPNAPRRREDKPSYPAATAKFPPLRIALRGVGQVAISRIELTDGVIRLHTRAWPPGRRKILGRPAQRRGFPQVDFEKNAETLELAGGG